MNKELAKTIGEGARTARKALHLTQEEAADRLDISTEFYARIERGNSLPSILTFHRIAMALGVSADALLGRHRAEQQTFAPQPAAKDLPDVRIVLRRLRRAKPSAIRLVNMLLRELETTREG